MKILCTADLHGFWRFNDMPEADVLVIAGDFTRFGRIDEVREFNDYIVNYPVKHKIVVAGNHDWVMQDRPEAAKLITNAYYLQDSRVEVDGVRFYGSPWTPKFLNWAFMLPRGNIDDKWKLIPLNTDVLITHAPPAGQRDYNGIEYLGCDALRDRVQKIKPKLHIFGHVHQSYGTSFNEHTGFINASRCTAAYQPFNRPILVEI